jgi:hypothetical protein
MVCGDFEEAYQFDERIRVAQDAALTFVFHLHGYDTGRWEDFTGWRDEHKEQYAVAHGDKQHYGKPAPREHAQI